MSSLDRRLDSRLPLQMYMNAYIDDRPSRGFTLNINETGLYLNTLADAPLPPFTPVGLEFELPGINETIWAAGEICYDSMDDYFLGRGVRFTAMAGLHARLIKGYCAQMRDLRLRARLGTRAARATQPELTFSRRLVKPANDAGDFVRRFAV